MKNSASRNGICHGLSLPVGEEFDVSLTLHLSRKQTAQAKNQNLKFIAHSSPFDFLPCKTKKNEEIEPYLLHIRLVCFKLSENSYETVATNLDESEFDSVATQICRKFFRKNLSTAEVEACIAKKITPIRNSPSNPRKRRNTNPRTDTSFFLSPSLMPLSQDKQAD